MIMAFQIKKGWKLTKEIEDFVLIEMYDDLDYLSIMEDYEMFNELEKEYKVVLNGTIEEKRESIENYILNNAKYYFHEYSDKPIFSSIILEVIEERPDLDELLDKITPENRHDEIYFGMMGMEFI